MIRHGLEFCGAPCIIGGNFQRPALDLLKDDSPDRISILELSSFQPMTLSVSPHIGVVLRVSTEHLDWHLQRGRIPRCEGESRALAEEGRLLRLYEDAAPSAKISTESAAQKLCVSTRTATRVIEGETPASAAMNFILRIAGRAACTSSKIWPPRRLPQRPRALVSRVPNHSRLTTPAWFRMEFKGEIAGIEFYNDSYATRPDATIAAVKSMKRPLCPYPRRVGKERGFLGTFRNARENQEPEASRSSAQRRSVCLIPSIRRSSPSLRRFSRRSDEAFAECLRIGRGGTVMLSLACASSSDFQELQGARSVL